MSRLTQLSLAIFASATLFLQSGVAQASDSPAMKDFIGLNVHTVLFDPQMALYQDIAHLLRDYHNLSWDIGTNTGNTPSFNPNFAGVNWDDLYPDWQDAGYEINPAIQWKSNFPDASDWNSLAADAYAYGQAFATHFGPTVGNGSVTSIQIGNEPGEYSPAEYRTILTNMAAGVRSVDSQLKIVTCNMTAGVTNQYNQPVQQVFNNQSVIDAVDVIAIQVYAQLEGWPTWERSYPEDPAVLYYLNGVQELIDWRDANAPDKEIWITEFGYDASTQPAPSSGTFKDWKDVTDTQQAQWIVRSYLNFAGMDVDRAYLYWFNDNDSPSLHASSGLTRNFQPKESYWAVKHLQATLGDFEFDEVIREDDEAYIYEFVNEDDPMQIIWVLWSPTGTDLESLVVVEDLPGEITLAEVMPLADGAAPTPVYAMGANGTLGIWVGESPVYLHMTLPAPEPAAGVLLGLGALALVRRRAARI